MRQVGAGFDWALLLGYNQSFFLYFLFFICSIFRWVPEGTVLSEDYDRYVLDADINAEYNALHEAVMDTLYDEEEDI
jgi:hypothetical protein